MKKTTLQQRPAGLWVLVLFAMAFSACEFSNAEVIRGDGNVTTTTRQLDYFEGIDLQGVFNVVLTPGTQPDLALETDENLMELISISVENNLLSITTSREVMLRPTKMELRITYPALNYLEIGGACKIFSEQVLESEGFTLQVSGAADIDLKLDVGLLQTSVSGAGKLKLEGYANEHRINLSGASHLRAENLITRNTGLDLSGAGSAHIFSNDIFQANISGVGSVRYYENPKNKSINKSGLASVSSAD